MEMETELAAVGPARLRREPDRAGLRQQRAKGASGRGPILSAAGSDDKERTFGASLSGSRLPLRRARCGSLLNHMIDGLDEF